MGGIVKSLVGVIAPIAIGLIPGVGPIAAGVIGGAIGGIVQGGGLKGALTGALTGGAGAAFGGGLKGGLFGGATGSAGGVTGLAGGGFGGGSIGNALARSAVSSPALGIGALGGASAATSHLAAGTAAGNTGSMFGATTTSAPGTSIYSSAIGGTSGGAIQSSMAASTAAAPNITRGTSTSTTGSNPAIAWAKKNAGSLAKLAGGGMQLYEDSIRKQQLEGLQKNINSWRPEYASSWATQAKAELAKLDAGELPERYDQALADEDERIKRLMIAQGHNPAESGFGATEFVKGTGNLRKSFIDADRDYWRAVAGGASGMQNQVDLLNTNVVAQQNQASAAGTTGDMVKTLLDLV